MTTTIEKLRSWALQFMQENLESIAQLNDEITPTAIIEAVRETGEEDIAAQTSESKKGGLALAQKWCHQISEVRDHLQIKVDQAWDLFEQDLAEPGSELDILLTRYDQMILENLLFTTTVNNFRKQQLEQLDSVNQEHLWWWHDLSGIEPDTLYRLILNQEIPITEEDFSQLQSILSCSPKTKEALDNELAINTALKETVKASLSKGAHQVKRPELSLAELKSKIKEVIDIVFHGPDLSADRFVLAGAEDTASTSIPTGFGNIDGQVDDFLNSLEKVKALSWSDKRLQPVLGWKGDELHLIIYWDTIQLPTRVWVGKPKGKDQDLSPYQQTNLATNYLLSKQQLPAELFLFIEIADQIHSYRLKF